jgi:TldD protein
VDVDADARASISAIVGSGGTVFVEHRDSLTLRLEGGSIEPRGDRDIGAGVRYSTNSGNTAAAYASTNNLTPPGLFDAAEVAAAVSGASAALPGTPADSWPDVDEPADPSRTPAASVDLEVKATTLRRVADAARAADPRVRSVSVTYVDVVQHVLIAGPGRPPVRDVRARTRVTCRVTARVAGGRGNGFDGPGIAGGFELFDDHPPEEIGRTATRRAILQLEGIEFTSRASEVVLGPSAGGMFVHEACGHGLEGDLIARRASVFCDTFGDRIASDMLTVVDDPSRPGGFGSYSVDDEGQRAAPVVLIDRGIQVGALTDSVSARQLDGLRAVSANGRRENYAHAPLCRMSNTYLDRGSGRAEDIVGDVAQGVYVARLSGGDVDTATGDFTFAASEAYRIDAGRLAEPLRGVTLIGNSFEALRGVVAIADDLAFTEAMCGKDGQWVPVSYGSPTMRIRELIVTGAG